MKKATVCLPIGILIAVLLLGQQCRAQQWDYLDVAPGSQTLNNAVKGDTTATGQPKSYNRVYRLQRGGVYLLLGGLFNIGSDSAAGKQRKGAPLRIFAADGPGAKPLIVMTVNQAGASDDFAYFYGDGHLKNLFISGIDNSGKQCRYTMGIYQDSTKLILDGVEVDHSRQSCIRSYGNYQKLFVMNSIIRNSIDLATPSNGRFFDGRGTIVDSVVWQNNTFFVTSHRMFRTDGAITKNIIFDHNTFYLNSYGEGSTSTTLGWKLGGPLEIRKAINARITNNIFKDVCVEAYRHMRTRQMLESMCIAWVDSLGTNTFATEEQRNWVVKNNAYGWSPGFKTFWAGIDTVKAPMFIGKYGDSVFYSNPAKNNFVQSNNFEEVIQFADAPSADSLLKWVKHRFATNFSNAGNPDPRADRNGISDITNTATYGPDADPFNFDYAASHKAYTAGDNGFPLGDLNWFPSLKTRWEKGVPAGVAENETGAVTTYSLDQNYPNPFNPSTQISYALPIAERVTITIFNALGQVIVRLVNDEFQGAGVHRVRWNGKSASGAVMTSGVYFYEMRTPAASITRKMVLMK